jgi:hypothetical protein
MLTKLRDAILERRLIRDVRKSRKEEIERLLARILSRNNAAFDAATGSNEEATRALLRDAQKANESDGAHLRFLIQREIRAKLDAADIEIPERYFVSGIPGVDNLSVDGESWARATLRQHHRENIEFWFKLVMPVLSLILSIIALYVAAHKH